MTTIYRILHLEDEPLDAQLVQAQLGEEAIASEVHVVYSEPAFVAALQTEPLDLILADFALPAFDGRKALSLARELQPDIPFIFVTGQMGEEGAIEVMKQGATDYVLKSGLDRLGAAVRRALQEAAERQARQQAEVAIEVEREWLRVTLASIGDAIITTDEQGQITFMNAVAEELTGWRQDEAAGQPVELVFEVQNELTGMPVESPVARVLREGMVASLANHTLLIRRDGELVPIDDSGAPIRTLDGRILGVVLVFRDVTQRRQAERAADRTARLQQVTAALTPALSAGAVTQLVVEQSQAALNGSASAVYLATDDGEWLELAGSQGYPEPVRRAVQRLPAGASLPGPEVYRSGEPLWLGSDAELVARYPMLATARASTGNEAVAVLPLITGERAFGVLALSFSQAREFEPSERDFLLTLAGQCAQALERTRLHEAERQARYDAEQTAKRMATLQAVTAALAGGVTSEELAEVVIGQGGGNLGEAVGAVFTVNADEARLELISSYKVSAEAVARFHHMPLSTPLPATQAVRERRPLLFESAADLLAHYPQLAGERDPENEASAAVPMLLGDRVLGVIAFSLRTVHAFSADDLGYLVALSQQAAQALERAIAYKAERQARTDAEAAQRRLAIVSEASARLAASLDVQATLRTVVQLLLPAVADYCGIFLVGDDGTIYSAGSGHINPEREPLVAEMNLLYPQAAGDTHNLLGHVLRTGQTVRVPRVPARTTPTPPEQQNLWKVVDALAPVAIMGVPLEAHGRVFGALMLAMADSGRAFADADVPLLEDLARRAAVALDNARLFEAAQRFTAELEQRVEARTQELLGTEARFLALINSVQDYAIYMLDVDGVVASWNTGAARIKGYRAEEIVGQHFSRFYTPDDVRAGKPAYGLAMARQDGHFESEGWRVRKDGSRFWANVAITSVHSLAGEHIGFAKVTRDLTERIEMENSLRESREQLRRLSAHLDKAREEERTRIAREIHDELGGTLTGLKMDVTQLQRYVGPEGRHKLEAYAQAINEAVKTVRRIATELRPAILDDFGLLAAMEWQLREFERRSGIHCHWHCTLEAVELPGDNTTAVFRVFQESLTNIARHAQASEVRVTCTRLGSQLHLEIVDNGIGIAPQQLRGTRSLGLVGMRERVRQLGGTVDVQGRPGQGTTVAVTLPLEPPAG